MPDDLVLVRHGESVGNVARHAAHSGDMSHYTDEFVTTPGHRWQITETGVSQAQCVGRWLDRQFIASGGPGFDKHYVSPFRRTRQTAGHLGLTHPHPNTAPVVWLLNRALRERDWGDIGSIPDREFESREEYALNVRQHHTNPLYWTPPGGESIAHVAENRIRNVLDTLHREASGRRVVAVTHGETMMAFRLVLERLSDEAYEELIKDPDENLPNCAVLHYSRTGPADMPERTHLRWLRKAKPVRRSGGSHTEPQWEMEVGEWHPITFLAHTNESLLSW